MSAQPPLAGLDEGHSTGDRRAAYGGRTNHGLIRLREELRILKDILTNGLTDEDVAADRERYAQQISREMSDVRRCVAILEARLPVSERGTGELP